MYSGNLNGLSRTLLGFFFENFLEIVICTKRDRVKATHAQIMRVTNLDKYSWPSREINKRIVFISPVISLPLRL